MTSCCPLPRMRWSGATGAIARCKRVSTGCGRTRRSVRAWRWICGVKPTPKAVNKPWHHYIVPGLAKPGSFATVSKNTQFFANLRFECRGPHHTGGCRRPTEAIMPWLQGAQGNRSRLLQGTFYSIGIMVPYLCVIVGCHSHVSMDTTNNERDWKDMSREETETKQLNRNNF